MSQNIQPGAYKIVSLEGDLPTSFQPFHTVPPYYIVCLGLLVNRWKVEKVGTVGVYKFTDLGGYPSTGVKDGKVVVSVTYHPPIDREWLVTYAEAQGAFIIELADELGYGWTVSPEGSPTREIETKQIQATHSEPPRYPLSQLFRFERLDD